MKTKARPPLKKRRVKRRIELYRKMFINFFEGDTVFSIRGSEFGHKGKPGVLSKSKP